MTNNRIPPIAPCLVVSIVAIALVLGFIRAAAFGGEQFFPVIFSSSGEGESAVSSLLTPSKTYTMTRTATRTATPTRTLTRTPFFTRTPTRTPNPLYPTYTPPYPYPPVDVQHLPIILHP